MFSLRAVSSHSDKQYPTEMFHDLADAVRYAVPPERVQNDVLCAHSPSREARHFTATKWQQMAQQLPEVPTVSLRCRPRCIG
jgi:hypothetical protein